MSTKITWSAIVTGDCPVPEVGEMFDAVQDETQYLDVTVEKVEHIDDRPDPQEWAEYIAEKEPPVPMGRLVWGDC